MNIGNSIDDIKQIIHALPDAEQAEAQDLLNTLKATEEAAHPVLVEGALSKFSDLIKKHSDLLIAVGGWAVKLLIGQSTLTPISLAAASCVYPFISRAAFNGNRVFTVCCTSLNLLSCSTLTILRFNRSVNGFFVFFSYYLDFFTG